MAKLQTITEGEIQEISNTVTSRVVTEVVAQVQDWLRQLKSTTLDIAVTGESGAGKSSFINAFRGMGDEDPEAAMTGVTETTEQITQYVHPSVPTVRLWDLPGISTPAFHPEHYLQAVGLHQFDFFIIVASQRFRECHVMLAQSIKQEGKRFYFVRNKVDNDLEASARRRGMEASVILKQIKEDSEAGLRQSGVEKPQVFLISCFQPQRFDFPLLQKTLESELEGHKRHVFMLALPNFTSTVLENKRQVLQENLWRTAMAACLGAMTPGGAVHNSIPILVDTLRFYQQSFGVDTNSLHHLAGLTGKSYQELHGEVCSTSGQELSVQGVEKMLSQAAAGQQALSAILESRVPVLGTIAAGGTSFLASYYFLRTAIKDLSEDAERVMNRALAETGLEQEWGQYPGDSPAPT